jgi:hypothetical protein
VPGEEDEMADWTILDPQTGEVTDSRTRTEAAWMGDDRYAGMMEELGYLVAPAPGAPTCEHTAHDGYNPNGCAWCGTSR